jgi:hypothetical protein
MISRGMFGSEMIFMVNPNPKTVSLLMKTTEPNQSLGHTTHMDISTIHFHDTQILRVIEDCEADTLTMEVEYPVDCERNVFEKRLLIFEDVHAYQIFDSPFQGCPTILDASIIGTDGRWSRLRLETNAGRRELSCTAVRLIEYDRVA